MGQEYRHDDQDLRLLLPNGLPRTCCSNNNNNNNSDTNHDNSTMGDTNHPNDNIQPDGHSHSHPSPPPPPSHETTTPTAQELQNQLVLLTEQQQFIQRLRRMIGKDNVILVDEESHNTPYTTQTAPYLKGARIVHARGGPTTVDTTATVIQHHRTIIVTPQQLHHVVNILEACQQQNTMAQQPPSHPTGEKDSTRKNHYTCTVIPQGQNTGLTGGSTPRYDHHNNHHSQYYHMTIVLSLKQLNAIIPLDDGQRVCCMAGVGLASVRRGVDCVSFYIYILVEMVTI